MKTGPISGNELTAHWDCACFQGEATRGWFQSVLAMSLRMIDAACAAADASVVDVGGGTWRLVDNLLLRGHDDLTVVDLPETALHCVQERMGRDAARVRWIHANIRSWSPGRTFDVWHDRALLHFLFSEVDQQYDVESASRPGSIAVFGCFASDGPARCSGWPFIRRDSADLPEVLGSWWSIVVEEWELHTTPGGVSQSFTWAAFMRAG